MQVKKLTDNAITPTRGSEYAAGADIYSVEETVIPPREHRLISTGIAAQAPEGCYIRIAPRSGLAAKHSIDVLAGVVDRDYRGEIKVILINNSNQVFKVSAGDRVAQLICERAVITDIVEVDDLDYTERGSAGFGSTGR
jgi:deoxyuridine 5'-triphosphate nucleotidohydrolase